MQTNQSNDSSIISDFGTEEYESERKKTNDDKNASKANNLFAALLGNKMQSANEKTVQTLNSSKSTAPLNILSSLKRQSVTRFKWNEIRQTALKNTDNERKKMEEKLK